MFCGGLGGLGVLSGGSGDTEEPAPARGPGSQKGDANAFRNRYVWVMSRGGMESYPRSRGVLNGARGARGLAGDLGETRLGAVVELVGE